MARGLGLASILLLGSHAILAQGAPIGAETHALYQRWESVQLDAIRERAAQIQANGPADTAIIVVRADDEMVCHRLTGHMGLLSKDVTPLSFTGSHGQCVARLPRLVAGDYSLTLDTPDGEPTSRLVSSFTASEQTEELAFEIARGILGTQLSVVLWPDVPPETWLVSALNRVPGFESAAESTIDQLRRRPQWQLARAACWQAPDAEVMARVIAFLGEISTESYGPEELEALTECALALQMVDAASRFLAHWDALSDGGSDILATKLRLAQLQLRVGDYPGVLDTVNPEDFSSPDRVNAEHLKSMALMALGRWDEVVDVLKTGAHLTSRPNTTALESRDNPSLFMRYNLALALLKTGQQDAGLAVLDALGSQASNSAISQALIDQANLMLGWFFLQRDAGATAGPVFERISLEGPFSRQAILGLGWAHIIAPGGRVKRATPLVDSRPEERSPAVLKALYQAHKITCAEYREALADNAVCSARTYFAQSPEASGEDRESQAITAWSHLLAMDLRDDISIEGALALADALQKQGRYDWAERLYGKAIDAAEWQGRALDGWEDTGRSLAAPMPSEVQMSLLEAEPQLLQSLEQKLNAMAIGGSEGSVRARDLASAVGQRLSLWVDRSVSAAHQRLNARLIDARFKQARLLELQR